MQCAGMRITLAVWPFCLVCTALPPPPPPSPIVVYTLYDRPPRHHYPTSDAHRHVRSASTVCAGRKGRGCWHNVMKPVPPRRTSTVWPRGRDGYTGRSASYTTRRPAVRNRRGTFSIRRLDVIDPNRTRGPRHPVGRLGVRARGHECNRFFHRSVRHPRPRRRRQVTPPYCFFTWLRRGDEPSSRRRPHTRFQGPPRFRGEIVEVGYY